MRGRERIMQNPCGTSRVPSCNEVLTRRTLASSVSHQRAPLITARTRENHSMRTFRYVSAALAGALCIGSMTATAAPAALGSGLRELAAAYDRGDASLQFKLSLNLHDAAGNPLIRARVLPGASPEQVLCQTSGAGLPAQGAQSDRPLAARGLPAAVAGARRREYRRRGFADCDAPPRQARRPGAQPGSAAGEG